MSSPDGPDKERVSEGLNDALLMLTDALNNTSTGLSKASDTIRVLNGELESCRSAVLRVMQLHRRYFGVEDVPLCDHCSGGYVAGCSDPVVYPCPTLKALGVSGD